MSLSNMIRAIVLLAALALHLLPAARASSHQEAPLLFYDAVELDGFGPVFAADGNLVAVERVRFRALSADGGALEGSGSLALPAPPAGGDAAPRGIIDGILGRVDNLANGTMPPFNGWAVVILDTIDVDGEQFRATGELRLQAEFLKPAADVLNVRIEFVQTSNRHRPHDSAISGLAEVRFSGVGRRHGVAVTVAGTAEFQFQVDAADDVDWFMGFDEWKIYAALADTATGGALLFEEVDGAVGQARIVAPIDASVQVDLHGALGQVTLDR